MTAFVCTQVVTDLPASHVAELRTQNVCATFECRAADQSGEPVDSDVEILMAVVDVGWVKHYLQRYKYL